MFKGLHYILNKSSAPTETMRHPHAHPIQSAKELLTPNKRQRRLKEIRALLNLPPKLYDTLYYKVIENFSEFVQELPETHRGLFSNDGGFLDHALERTSRALSLCLAYFFPEEKTFHNLTSQQALWIYAVFTAALLLDIGKIAVKYAISVCQKDGSTTKEWLPYSGPLTAHGKFYKYNFVKENRDNLRRLVTGLLARQLLTEIDNTGTGTTTGGFNWIASNPDVLEAWLSILYGEGRPIHAFLTVIPLADMQTIQNYFNTINPSEEAYLPNLDIAKDFLQWLQNAIANGTLSVNQADSFIHSTADGMMILDGAYKKFSQQSAMHVTPEGIEREFRQLIELYQGSIGDLGQRYSVISGSISRQTLSRFLLIHNPYLLYAMGQQPPAQYSEFLVRHSEPAAAMPPSVEPTNHPHEHLQPR